MMTFKKDLRGGHERFNPVSMAMDLLSGRRRLTPAQLLAQRKPLGDARHAGLTPAQMQKLELFGRHEPRREAWICQRCDYPFSVAGIPKDPLDEFCPNCRAHTLYVESELRRECGMKPLLPEPPEPPDIELIRE